MEEVRLQKFLARAGVASRRASEALIVEGRVSVNGRVRAELGTKINPETDKVEVDGVAVRAAQESVILMLHKPAGFVTTMKDMHARHTVAELIPLEKYPALFPLGRLDQDTTGLLLFSTDGDLGHAVLRPRGHVTKRYLALVDGVPSAGQLQHLREGVPLDDGITLPAEVELLCGSEAEAARELLHAPTLVPPNASKRYARACKQNATPTAVVRIGIHEGRNRQVRRMLAFIGHPVLALHRETFGPLALGDLPRGEWRPLTEQEARALRNSSAQ